MIPQSYVYRGPAAVDYAQDLSAADIASYETFVVALRHFLNAHDCGQRLIQLRTSTTNAQLIRDWVANRATTDGCDPFLRASLVGYFLAYHGLALEIHDDGVWSDRVAADLWCSFDAPQTQRCRLI